MEIEYGSQVLDKNGKILGTVNHVIRNTWSGEIKKFMVRSRLPDSDRFFVSPQNVLQATGGKIKLNVSLEELSKIK